jgi:hypothetical protein
LLTLKEQHQKLNTELMKKQKKKLQLNKETVTVLNNQKLQAIAGGDTISKTNGTIYHCKSLPFVCDI